MKICKTVERIKVVVLMITLTMFSPQVIKSVARTIASILVAKLLAVQSEQ